MGVTTGVNRGLTGFISNTAGTVVISFEVESYEIIGDQQYYPYSQMNGTATDRQKVLPVNSNVAVKASGKLIGNGHSDKLSHMGKTGSLSIQADTGTVFTGTVFHKGFDIKLDKTSGRQDVTVIAVSSGAWGGQPEVSNG